MSGTDEPAAGPALAVSALVRRGDRFLLVLRANPPAQHMYAFPGGRVEPGESLEAAALRELEEETGLRGANPRPLATYDLPTRRADGTMASHFLLTVFAVDGAADAEIIAADDAMTAGWYTREELDGLPVPDSVIECLDLIARNDRP
ncbi:ADP-ribose pyrophosphatase YjhB (NUDIX family) [Hoeflea marina]|uniref:ADP-ribose pyrophosphatase YjhB (NUDIX family) n=1 Tax=Hoeflea marina TaxID=274592 RepID=A0A317PEZ3_9HYPH|nr:NUDIX domain-containing protein [Hoeflea marina]PWV98751.1 ADP-ribose pyrophosphatase YjhB (NUDIX family) [Hoeflea marina]